MTTRNGTHPNPGATAEKFSRLYERPLPYSLEAEMSLLGSMILDPRVVPDVQSILTGGADSFYDEGHGAIYSAIIDSYDSVPDADLVIINETLRERGQDVGGAEYLEKLARETPSAAGAQRYARIVADKHLLRQLIDASDSNIHDAMNASGLDDAADLLDRAESRIFTLSEVRVSGAVAPASLGELLDAELARLRDSDGTGQHGISTGFYDLDRTLAGLHPGEMVVLAARPSMGKTALVLNIAEQLARGGITPDQHLAGAPIPVGIFSLEMSKAALLQRTLSAFAQVDSTKIRAGTLSRQELAQVEGCADVLGSLPIFIDDSSNLNLLTLRAQARRLVSRHGVRVITIDYLQLLNAPEASKRDNRQVEVSAISRGIKSLAKELGVPIVVLSQLNRASEQRQGNRPRMSDLRESGSIEQDADVVLLLHREDYYHRDDQVWRVDNPDKVNVAELIVEKQRNGPTGVVYLTWDPRTTRFKSNAGGSAAASAPVSASIQGRLLGYDEGGMPS